MQQMFIGLSQPEKYWIATLLGGENFDRGYGIEVDRSGNVYVLGAHWNSNFRVKTMLAKFNSSGVIQWHRVLSGENNDQSFKLDIDSSGNVYVVGTTYISDSSFGNQIFIVKYNTSGTLQWQRTLGAANWSSERGYGVSTDSLGNVYVFGNIDPGPNGNRDFAIAKYNTSGTLQWQRILGGSNDEFNGLGGIDTDSSGNVYITGNTGSAGAGSGDLFIAKYNSSGTIQWQRTLSGFSNGRGIDIDSSGNVYVISYGNINNTNCYLIAKYNSSGTIQWQRLLYRASPINPEGIAVHKNNLYVMGWGGSPNEFIFAKLPTDGSLTGTYDLYDSGEYTYSTSSYTSSTVSLTSSTSTLNSSAAAFTSSTSSLTELSLPSLSQSLLYL